MTQKKLKSRLSLVHRLSVLVTWGPFLSPNHLPAKLGLLALTARLGTRQSTARQNGTAETAHVKTARRQDSPERKQHGINAAYAEKRQGSQRALPKTAERQKSSGHETARTLLIKNI